ncbi:MAG: hypothetical protein WCX31_20990 [Salinivirgaceae bacterium]
MSNSAMNLPEIHKNNIDNYLDKEDIILATIQQIMKDFGMFGLEITFSGDINQAYQEMHSQLTQQVDLLIVRDAGRLYSILYQVDISNKALEITHQENPEFTIVEVIAHQIIERDLKKVLTRRYFSSL